MSASPDSVPGAVPEKRAAQIALCIEADIIRRGWPVGESLGCEHELRQRYGASRSVLREGVRLVEHHRVARMRRGPGGGLFVSAPDAAPAARAVVIYLEHRGTTVDELLDSRRVLEPLETPVVIAELPKNPVLHLFTDVLMRLSERYGIETGGDGRTTEARQGKRAEVLAATIGEDIAGSGLPAGSVFATEAELLHRYGVSRAILREALRLLEYHTVARTRRGPGGGLLVTEPLAQPSIDTFALYLQYRRPSRKDVRVVRDAIEPGLAQSAGNAVLELFLRILDGLF